MLLDQTVLSRALDARDARFDGVFFVGVRSTGIYCRPICPARTTLAKNRRFFSHAGAAERAGFRPCLRCRPELAPGLASVDAVPRLAQSAARRIAAGALNGAGVESLAQSLGVSARQLRRSMQQEVGATPIALAQTHRLLLAKQLLTDTCLPVAQVAYASGFQSVRRFNALFVERYRLNPLALRRTRTDAAPVARDEAVHLALSYRPPLDWSALLAFLAARATPGVEHVTADAYSRTIRVGAHAGVIRVTRVPARAALDLAVSASLLPVLLTVVAHARRLFDLDAEPEHIASVLAGSVFGKLAGEERGLRVPGAVDGFELAVRAILGQQVSVKGATTLMTRLTRVFGDAYASGDDALTHLPVTAERLASAPVSEIAAVGLPLARATTIHTVASVCASGTLRLEPDCNVRALTRQLVSLRGVGPWTAEYIVMRAVHWPDAFPSSDLVLCRAAGDVTPAALTRLAEQWRPWRAYAAMHLWRKSAL